VEEEGKKKTRRNDKNDRITHTFIISNPLPTTTNDRAEVVGTLGEANGNTVQLNDETFKR
jgi:hypothetical protein